MRAEFVAAGIFIVAGLVASVFPRRVADFFSVAGYVFSKTFGDEISAERRPAVYRFVGIGIVAFSVFVIVDAARHPARAPMATTESSAAIAAFTVAGVLAVVGISVVLFHGPLAVFVARRLRMNGADLSCGADVDRYARTFVWIEAAWILLITTLPMAVGIEAITRN